MTRKIIVMLTTTMIAGMLVACGQKEETVPGVDNGIETEAPTNATEENVAEGTTEEPAQTEVSDGTDAETAEEEATGENTGSGSAGASLESLAALLGMQDEETADAFGGGEENWTEDRSFYIGRIYEISLYDEPVKLHTTCDDDKVVNSISVWLADETKPATEEAVNTWVERLTEFTGSEPTYDDTSSEAGSKNWSWRFDGKAASLYWLGDTLSFSIQPAVGELK